MSPAEPNGRRPRRDGPARACGLAAWLVLAAWLAPSTAAARPFTYQGRLADGTQLAAGAYELTFRLFDSATAGSQVGAAVVLPAVAVTNGLFTVQLDFGADAFNGADRWLELAAREQGAAGDPETLVPRQPVTAVPYALRAFTGSGDAGELTTGTVPDARLSPAIARTAELIVVSNQFSAQTAALTAQVDALSAAVTALSNQVAALLPTGLPPGLAAASTDPADAALGALGWARFSTLDAPGWRNGAPADAPAARFAHATAWTGQQWLVWGGTVGGGVLSGNGAAYDPALDQWTPLSTINPPAARRGHTAVWTGEAMLVWGGFGGAYLGTGAAYAPATLAWTPLATAGAPDGRDGHAAVWTGARMLVWGGRNAGGLLADGALYDPASDQWTALPATGAPAARLGAAGAWTGTQFLVWGGEGEGGELATGAVLPVSGGTAPGAWAAMAAAGAPSARTAHAAVWTGQRFIVWGGRAGGAPLGDGAAYDPVADAWTPLPATNAPAARAGHVAVWTGTEMLVFGGETAGGASASGAAYDPAAGKWRTLSGAGPPLARTAMAGVWTGTELLVFGGTAGGAPLAALQRLDPSPAWHLFRKP
jgi:hypothetical protein